MTRTRLTVGSTETTSPVRGRAITDMCMSSTGLVMRQWLQTQGPCRAPSVDLLEHVRVDRFALALERDRAEAPDPRAGQLAQRADPDRDRAYRRRARQPGGDVHRVADHGVALALARADHADHRLAAVDPDPEARP